MPEKNQFTLELRQLEGLEFSVKFDLDHLESLRIGGDDSPSASRLIAAAAANCLGASLLYCVAKNDPPAGSMRATAVCHLERNAKGRTRISGIEVRLKVNDELGQALRMQRCLDLYQDFSLAAQSLRQGIPVDVQVVDERGEPLHRSQHST